MRQPLLEALERAEGPGREQVRRSNVDSCFLAKPPASCDSRACASSNGPYNKSWSQVYQSNGKNPHKHTDVQIFHEKCQFTSLRVDYECKNANARELKAKHWICS